MSIKFIDRKKEMNYLMNKLNSNQKELIIVYGRRRVGKTELIKRVLEKFKGKGIYFFARIENKEDSLKRICSMLVKKLRDFSLINNCFNSWADFFNYIKDKDLIIVIDEFPNLLKESKEFLSTLQEFWDFYMSNKIKIVLTGSYISTIEKLTLSYNSPIYGRRTGQLKVERINPYYLKKLFGNLENSVKVFGVVDSIPGYFIKINNKNDLFREIEKKILQKGEFLYEEVEFLLREELKELHYYFSILKAISLGKNKLSEIANFTNLDKSLLSKYLNVLDSLDIIKKDRPIFSKDKERNTLYKIKDNYFKFWFRYVYNYKDYLEMENKEFVIKKIKEDFNNYLGPIFEEFIFELLKEKSFLPFQPLKFGRWWYKDNEIDLVAFNEQEKKIAFLEAKWQDLKLSDVKRIVKELEEKVDVFYERAKLNKSELKEYFGVVAKKMDEKAKRWLKDNDYLAYELKDFDL